MITLGKPLTAREAADIGMISQLVKDQSDLIDTAVTEIKRLRGGIPRISEEPIDIPELDVADQPMAGKQTLSKEAVAITADTVKKGAAATSLEEALEILKNKYLNIEHRTFNIQRRM